jgi:hypothetical protein
VALATAETTDLARAHAGKAAACVTIKYPG